MRTDNPVVASFSTKYTDEQRDALAFAFEDRGIRPAQRVVDLAAAGELEFGGRTLEKFETNASTVRSLARDHRRRRVGQHSSELAKAPARDALEALRRRLVNVLDAGIAAIERKQKRSGGAVENVEEVRQMTRVLRELSAIPGQSDPRPPAPGVQVNGVRNGGTTRGGAAGSLLRAYRESTAPASPEPPADPLETLRSELAEGLRRQGDTELEEEHHAGRSA